MPTRRATPETPGGPEPGRGVGPLAGLTEEVLRAAVPEPIVGRGLRYAGDGAVAEVALRGSVLHAAVQGSEDRPYHVAVRRVTRGRAAGGPVAACTCPYMDGAAAEPEAWCKHVVAALLVALRDPEGVAHQAPVPALVAPLDRAALVQLLGALVDRDPELYDALTDEVTRRAPPRPTSRSYSRCVTTWRMKARPRLKRMSTTRR